MLVLIAEDISSDRKILRMYLEKVQHTVLEARNGLEALNMARKENPDLIISDALMPELDGFELLRECKQDEQLQKIPFIFYSATYTDQREIDLALELGAEAFLNKPMEPEAFWKSLREILDAISVARPHAPVKLANQQSEFYTKYAKIVAAKLKEKVAQLEEEIFARKEAEKVMGKHYYRSKKLLELSRKSIEIENEFFDMILDTALNLTDSPIGYLYFYDEGTRLFTLHAWSKEVMKECLIREPQTTYELGKTGLWGEAVRQRKAIVVNDYEAPNILKKGLPEGHASLIRHLNLPIFDEDQIVAVLGVGNKPDKYSEIDVEQLRMFSEGAWTIFARQKAKVSQVESEKRYRRIFKESLDGVYRIDAAHSIKDCNQAFATMFGFKDPAEVSGLSVKDFWVDENERQKYFDELQKKKRLQLYSVNLLNKNHELVHAEISSRILEHADGSFAGIEGIIGTLPSVWKTKKK